MRPTYSEITCEDMASYLWCLSIHPGNIYRKGWTDATTPRTDKPVRFVPRMFLAGQYPGERPYFPSKVAPRPLPPA